jgi:hypothetical protein
MTAAEHIPAPLSIAATASSAGTRWIDLATAAKRSGLSASQLSRKCGDVWFGLGLARIEPPTGGGKKRWIVREDADERFAPVVLPDRMSFDLRTLSDTQRAGVLLRESLLTEWSAAKREAFDAGRNEERATDAFLDRLETTRGISLSRSTLYRWHRQFRDEGRAGLLDGRGAPDSADDGAAGDDPFLSYVRALWLAPGKPAARSCWFAGKQRAVDNGWAWKAYRTTARYLKSIPDRAKVKLREGSDAYTAKCEPSIERDYTTLHTNEQWVGDHHQFDVVVNDRGRTVRPWLTAWMDMRSRMIVGYCIYPHDPNQNSILSALRAGILEHGIPDLLYVDNGKDFDSYAFHGRTKRQRRRGRVQLDAAHAKGILGQLGCEARFCWAYHGQSKPIERWFRTVEDRFGKTFATYCGNKPENRPEQHADRVARGEAVDLTDFVAEFARWIEVDYHAAPHLGHGMDGRSPTQVFQASWNGHPKRTASRDLLDLLLAKPQKPVKVGKNGVRWAGLTYGQYEPALNERWGQEVYLRVDERDVTSVQVWSPDDRFICLAACNEKVPANATEQQKREATARKKHASKLHRQYRRARLSIGDSTADYMIRGAAEEHARNRPATPPDAPTGPTAIKPLRTPFEVELVKVQREREARREPDRIAVGAESMVEGFAYTPPVRPAGFAGTSNDGDDLSPAVSFHELMANHMEREDIE